VAIGENTRKCQPGDIITISGVFLPSYPEQKRGYESKGGLVHDVYIDTFKIVKEKKRYD